MPTTAKNTAIVAVICCASVFTAVQGLSYPLLSLMLERDGHSDLMIGLSASSMPAGMIAAGLMGPRVIARHGSLRVALCSLFAAAALLVTLKITATQPWVWFPIRFGIGAAVSCLFITTDVWANRLAGDRSRGRIMGVYAASMAAGFALGPAALALVGTETWSPFALACVFVSAAAVTLVLTRRSLPSSGPAPVRRQSVASFAKAAPALVALVALVALIEQTVFALLPVWSIAHGMAEESADALLSMMPIGSIVISFLIGLAADKFPAPRVIVTCCLTAALAIALLPGVATNTILAWVVMFVFGGFYYGIYVLALDVLGSRFVGGQLVAGGAAFGVFWGIGGLLGSSVFGTTSQLLGVWSLPILLALALVVAVPAVLRAKAQLA